MVTDKRIKLIRNHHLTKNLLVLDGLSGTGKTMMSAILQSFDRVENGRFIYDVEYISISSYLGAHRSDSAQSLLDLLFLQHGHAALAQGLVEQGRGYFRHSK